MIAVVINRLKLIVGTDLLNLAKCIEKGFLIRTTGDIIALSPPLIITKQQIDELISKFNRFVN